MRKASRKLSRLTGNYLAAQPQDSSTRARFVQLLVANKQFDEALAETEKSANGQAPTLEALRLRADILIGKTNWTKPSPR